MNALLEPWLFLVEEVALVLIGGILLGEKNFEFVQRHPFFADTVHHHVIGRQLQHVVFFPMILLAERVLNGLFEETDELVVGHLALLDPAELV